MSFDLGVWYADPPITSEEAARRYVSRPDDESEAAEPRAEVGAFYDALTRDLPDLTADNYETSPWSTPLTVGEDFVVMRVVFPRAAEVCRVVLPLVDEHGLVCFDPEAELLREEFDMMDKVRFTAGDATVVLAPDFEDILRESGEPAQDVLDPGGPRHDQ
ncbi:hypothetical protein [Sphaerisporangium fuscum]|uniref:hypothetical protein n=1 Tax=Sphaerisporangium fuscum TaxID=2835868 RepID=UPI001BDCD780|nr:hypothetical protein [Sphaerisporangium fuscum]